MEIHHEIQRTNTSHCHHCNGTCRRGRPVAVCRHSKRLGQRILDSADRLCRVDDWLRVSAALSRINNAISFRGGFEGRFC